MVEESEEEDERMEESIEEEEDTSQEEEEVQIEDEAAAVEEEIKPLPTEEDEKEEVVEERFYTIPLGKAWIAPSKKRVPRAIRIIKEFMKRHMKLRKEAEFMEEEDRRLTISNEVNERIWSRGIKKPPRKVRVRATRDREGNVHVYLAEGD